MCGIVGYVGSREVVPLLIDGLRRLEYRGYDSAGVVAVHDGRFETAKAEGKLGRLREKLVTEPVHGVYGLGHTRWATHGPPSERNAHPMVDSKQRVALIHNGIIENFLPLKKRLIAEGWTFTSDTDTEVLANLISSYLEGVSLEEAVARASREAEGMYAFAVVSTMGDGQKIVASRQGPPLVLGMGNNEQFLASDPSALLAYTRDVIFLENGDLAVLTPAGITLFDRHLSPVERPVQRLNWDPVQAEKGGFKHFMLKEIHEQPRAIADTISVGRMLTAISSPRLSLPLKSFFMLSLPLTKGIPALYIWIVRRRLLYWYNQLKALERNLDSGGARFDPEALQAEFDRIDQHVRAIRVPSFFSHELYDLRGHIELMRQRLAPRAYQV